MSKSAMFKELTMKSLITTTVGPSPAGRSSTLGIVDYICFVFMLAASTAVGVYFGFITKSKNTTEEYLIGGRRMRPIPIAISLIASQLSVLSITTVPAETYTFGFNHYFIPLSMIVVAPILCYITTPVFYENNLFNCYEYLEKRYNKLTRRLVTFTFILNAFLLLPVIIFVPSLAFSQVSGFNIHAVNAVVCAICVFYTMVGGIKAVVWTDVIQGGITLSCVILICVMGTIKTGGIFKVFEYAAEGGRLDTNYSLDPRVRITFWNSSMCGIMIMVGLIGLNQSSVQRIVALPSLKDAQKTLWLTSVGIFAVLTLNTLNGFVMYSYYRNCDPLRAGLVNKPDKMIPFFVQDIMGHLLGIPGLFVSCVFSAALSNMSAMLNSLGGVVYFDVVKPCIKQYHTEARANLIMKIIVVVMGCYCVFGGVLVQRFDSILQLIVTVTGINTGAVVGIFLLGMLVPRTNGKVAATSVIFSMILMLWLVIKGQIRAQEGAVVYTPLPTNIDGCAAHDFQVLMESISSTNNLYQPTTIQPTEVPKITTAFGSNRDFSIFEISFYWYKVIGVLLVWILGIPLSYIWRYNEEEKLNPQLYAPIIRRFLPQRKLVEMERNPLKMPHTMNENGMEDF